MNSKYAAIGAILALAPVGGLFIPLGVGWLTLLVLIVLGVLSYVVAAKSTSSAFGEAARGWLIGLNVGGTFFIGETAYGAVFGDSAGLAMAVVLGGITGISVIRPVSQTKPYQALIGWANWLLPMSWLIIGIGALLYVLSLLGHLVLGLPGVGYFRIVAFGVDWMTGTYFMKGGFVSNLNPLDTAFNMGSFSFVDAASATWHMKHEAGHTLNLGAFGSVFHLVGALDENVTGAGANALSERLAESHSSGESGNNIPMWI